MKTRKKMLIGRVKNGVMSPLPRISARRRFSSAMLPSVPGMFSRMADWQPPEMAPMYTPISVSTASGPSML